LRLGLKPSVPSEEQLKTLLFNFTYSSSHNDDRNHAQTGKLRVPIQTAYSCGVRNKLWQPRQERNDGKILKEQNTNRITAGFGIQLVGFRTALVARLAILPERRIIKLICETVIN